MIILKQDVEKPCIFRLSNLINDNSAEFLIELQDVNLEQVKLFTAPNTSHDRDRYDRFNITVFSKEFSKYVEDGYVEDGYVEEISNEDLENGKIFLPYGTYRYNAYVYNGGGLSLENTDGEIIDTDQFKVVENGMV